MGSEKLVDEQEWETNMKGSLRQVPATFRYEM